MAVGWLLAVAVVAHGGGIDGNNSSFPCHAN